MALGLHDRLRLSGTIGRRDYLLAGFGLTPLKFLIDRTVAERGYGRRWELRRYAFPGELLTLDSLPVEDRTFYLTMAAIALPFVAFGLVLTVRRLRDAGLPPYLALLFFAPLPLNLAILVAFGCLPPRRPAAGGPVPSEEAFLPAGAPAKPAPPDPEVLRIGPAPRSAFTRLMPSNDVACGVVAILASMPIAFGLGWLSVTVFSNYGWGLFVGLPVGLPMLSAMIFGLPKPRTLAQCIQLGLGWFLATFAVMVAFAFEGIVCLLLLAPLALPLVVLGSVLGYLVQRIPWEVQARLAAVLLVLQPLLIGAEGTIPREPPLFSATTAGDVDAPPEAVWRHVVSFGDLPPPDDWIFRTGIAYPIRAEIAGEGPGAVRHCVFSTGPFVEPIEVWDEPRLLRFTVTENPPPMKEWSPLKEIHPPHLDNYLVSRRGQFLLTPLPGGRTRLEGTTWYHHTMWPAGYWRFWSDRIIRRIHAQVLRHVKTLSEAEREAAATEGALPRRVRTAGPAVDRLDGYDAASTHEAVARHGYVGHIRPIGAVRRAPRRPGRRKPRRWVVDRTLARLSKCRALLVRYDNHAGNFLGLIPQASGLL